MSSICKRAGFTLVELLVVLGIIAVLMAAITTSVSRARERSRMQKALTEVKSISQAILSLEFYRPNHDLPPCSRQTISGEMLQQLIGKGTGAHGDKIPVVLQAAMSGGGEIRDPWGKPYRVSITEGRIQGTSFGSLRTGMMLPNFHRLSKGERE